MQLEGERRLDCNLAFDAHMRAARARPPSAQLTRACILWAGCPLDHDHVDAPACGHVRDVPPANLSASGKVGVPHHLQHARTR